MNWPTVFRTSSEIEARIVTGLLEAHGIPTIQSSDFPRTVFPVSVEGLGELRIAVPPDAADEAMRLIESHRDTREGADVVPIRHEFEALERRLG